MAYTLSNPAYVLPDNSMIKVTWDHPTYGPVPFSASPNDVEAHGREIYAQAVAAGGITPYAAPAVTQAVFNRAVDAERDRRLALPFDFNSKSYDRDPTTASRIAMQAASTSTPVDWIAADNTSTSMDAATFTAFATAYAAVETAIVAAARTLKDNFDANNPADPTDVAHWP